MNLKKATLLILAACMPTRASASYLLTPGASIGNSYLATDTVNDPTEFWIWQLGVNWAYNETMPLIVQVGGTTVFSGQVFSASPPNFYHIVLEIKENQAIFQGGMDTGDFVVTSERVGGPPISWVQFGQWENLVYETSFYPYQCGSLGACVFLFGGPEWSFLPESTVLAEPHMLFNIEAVPEPATLLLVLAGAALALGLRRRLV
jgi:hypothetical protein